LHFRLHYLNAPSPNSASASAAVRRRRCRSFGETDGKRRFHEVSLGVFSREETTLFLEKIIGWQRRGLPSQFAVIHRADNRLIGYCGFFHQQVDGTEEIEIGYRLDPDYWRRGLATEAVRAVRDHAFRDQKLQRVISLIHPDNAPSRRVAEKVGMNLEKKTVFRGFPTFVFALTREPWLAEDGAR
jgi:RimJ/RimL family protein N-acetyltransferase